MISIGPLLWGTMQGNSTAIYVLHDNFCSFPCEQSCSLRANALSGPSDDCDLSCKQSLWGQMASDLSCALLCHSELLVGCGNS